MPSKAWLSVFGQVQGGSACRESKGQRPWPSEVLKAQRPEEVSQRLTSDSDCLQSQSVASGDEIA